MDKSDPNIQFNEIGNCNYCEEWLVRMKNETFIGNPKQNLEKLVERIKDIGRDREFDCLIGVSGGVDSTYVAYLVKKN